MTESTAVADGTCATSLCLCPGDVVQRRRCRFDPWCCWRDSSQPRRQLDTVALFFPFWYLYAHTQQALEREFVAVHQLDSTSWRSKCWTKFAMSSRARLYVCFTTFTIVQQLTAFVQDFDGQRRAELFATLFLALTGVSNTRTNRIEIELQANPSRR